MNESDLRRGISNLSIWKKNGQRAPHKPLLLLFALAQLQRNQTALPFEEVRSRLKNLLFEFGPPRRALHPKEPFVRLTTDGIWELSVPIDKANFSEKQLIDSHVTGGFRPEVLGLLLENSRLVQEIAEQLLHEHFPESIHQDILEAVGLEFAMTTKRRRNPDFRNRVLRAYESSCAICGFNVRLGNHLVAVEAAHIQWHQAGGPDSEENGIALCALHHKLFDRGVFTITGDRVMLVAEEAAGTHGFDEWLMNYHGRRIRSPIRQTYQPKTTFVEWHLREVFRGPARYHVN